MKYLFLLALQSWGIANARSAELQVACKRMPDFKYEIHAAGIMQNASLKCSCKQPRDIVPISSKLDFLTVPLVLFAGSYRGVGSKQPLVEVLEIACIKNNAEYTKIVSLKVPVRTDISITCFQARDVHLCRQKRSIIFFPV